MTMSIGRLTGLQVVQTWQQAANQIGVEGKLKADTLNALQVARQQLEGYVDSPDEKVVPVTYSGDDTVDGFYRIESVDVDASVGAYAVGVLEFRVSMTRLHGYAAPLIESGLLGALRANDHAVASATAIPWIGLNPATEGVSLSGVEPDVYTRAGSTITHQIFETQDQGQQLYDTTVNYWLPPGSWYDGVPTLVDTRTNDEVVGRQTDMGVDDWRVENDLMRVASVPGAGQVSVEHWDGTTWRETLWTLELWDDGDDRARGVSHHLLGAPHTFTVLRNSPAAVSVRMAYEEEDTNIFPAVLKQFQVDLTVRRGARTVEGVFKVSSLSTSEHLVIAWDNGNDHTSGTHARTVLTAGAEREADDANGNKWVAASAKGTLPTSDTQAHVIEGAADTQTTLDFGVSMEVGTAAYPNRSQDLIYQYLAAQHETLRPVARG